MKAGDAERIPWHDKASHGSFVLFAGGLGSVYAGGQDEVLHGYGSGDYLSMTVPGGRHPMCDSPLFAPRCDDLLVVARRLQRPGQKRDDF